MSYISKLALVSLSYHANTQARKLGRHHNQLIRVLLKPRRTDECLPVEPVRVKLRTLRRHIQSAHADTRRLWRSVRLRRQRLVSTQVERYRYATLESRHLNSAACYLRLRCCTSCQSWLPESSSTPASKASAQFKRLAHMSPGTTARHSAKRGVNSRGSVCQQRQPGTSRGRTRGRGQTHHVQDQQAVTGSSPQTLYWSPCYLHAYTYTVHRTALHARC